MDELFSTENREWTLEVNGHYRQFGYWVYPFLVAAWDATQDSDDPTVLVTDDADDFWIRAGDDVVFHVPERDPRVPQRLTQSELEEFDEFEPNRSCNGYGYVHVYGSEIAFDDPGSARSTRR
ncbi:hypothetical protein ACFQNE_01905 [Gordonia phosphorivorans]|uniref:Uncharacterized protein n=1 Tax=Gordonia phosphorivorans TaxID=1056982 RepID=A0ABV6H6Y5_9ACTN